MQQKLIEYYGSVKERFSPEKSAISGILVLLSFGIIPVQTALTAIIHEYGHEIPTDEIKIIAIALLGVANIVSTAVETKALKEKQYSASLKATTLNIASGRPLESSIVAHISNFAQASTVFNPVNFLSIPAAFSGDGGRLIAENTIAITTAMGLWSIGFNTLILKDKAAPVIEKVRVFVDFLKRKYEKTRKKPL